MILIQVAGHIGADPEVRYTPSGQKVTTFRVATNVKRGQKEKTLWWRVTCWGDRFDKKLQYLKKGSAVIVVGDMGIPEIYQDREGNQQISLEITAELIQFSPFGKGDRSGQDNSAESQPEATQEPFAVAQKGSRPQAGTQNSTASNFSDDDIPF